MFGRPPSTQAHSQGLFYCGSSPTSPLVPPPVPPLSNSTTKATHAASTSSTSSAITSVTSTSSKSDVFRCVWCHEQFSTLSTLTAHLKVVKHANEPGGEKGPTNTSGNNSVKSTSKSGGHSHPPRKLVRGQDVWLGKGEEQTRQILKCMWCGQSFRSLADLTTHMSETKHYTKVIPQEQLSTWRAQDQLQQTSHSSSPSQSLESSPKLAKVVLKTETITH